MQEVGRAMEAIDDFLRGLRAKLYDRRHGHFIAYIDSQRCYIIYTATTLRNPKALFSKDFGEMLGVRSSILTQDFDYIVWVVERNNCISVYMERSYRVNSFCLENKTVYRNKQTGEYICNYPLNRTRKVYEKCITKTLMDYRK